VNGERARAARGDSVRSPSPSFQLAVMVAAFFVPTVITKAAGADWGEAATAGQIAFLAAALWAILAGPRLSGGGSR
jgi:hypothetical protein